MNTIIEKIQAEIERLKVDYLNRSYTFVPKVMQDLLDFLSDLEKEETSKRVRTLEREFDGYNSIVVTLDKHVLESIGVGRHAKVIIKIQRKED